MKESRMLKSYDDGGSFDRILGEAGEAANGDESLKLSLLTKTIVKDLVDKQMQELAAASLLIMRQEAVVTMENSVCVATSDYLDFRIPKRTRGTAIKSFPRIAAAMPPLPPLVLNLKKKKITVKRCFNQAHSSETEEEEEEAVIRKPKRQKKRKGNNDDQEQVAELPELFRNRIEEENGTDVVLVMQKHVTASDLKKNLNRLSIPKNQIRADGFINEEEKKILEDKKKLPIEVLLIPPSLKENVKLNLRRWPMGNTFSYNLIDKWWSCVVNDADNRLEVGSIIQLWRFRKNITDLCFALVKVD